MAEAAIKRGPLPVGSVHLKGLGAWGMACLIVTEGSLFGYLLFSYFYLAAHEAPGWFPSPLPKFTLSLPNTIILILSSIAAWWGEKGIKKGSIGQHLIGFGIAVVLGLIFLGVQLKEWHDKNYTLTTGPFASLYYTITGFHMAHVAVGVIGLFFVMLWSALGYFDKERNAPVSISAVYWHFVDVVWLTVFFSLYVTPHLWAAS